ncbi:sugar kinase [Thalassotalea euphylliae]|nr:sugar kinase [Thalassotalea euphylliae]
MKKIVVFGECMLEFAPMASQQYQRGIAGDVYNTSVYLQRLATELAQVSLLTALGRDAVSYNMLSQFQAEQLNTDYVYRHPARTVGAYLIDVDSEGERSFTYWRGQAAARETFALVSDKQLSQLIEHTDIFYFSGISIAILAQSDRERFWQFVEQLAAAGKQIVFDTNFRPQLWPDKVLAQQAFQRALKLSTTVFAGVEDLEQLAMGECFNSVAMSLKDYAIDELVIKHGEHGVQVIEGEKSQFIAIEPVANIVDTTSAGDSFNAGYLYARLAGSSASSSVNFASLLASHVIQHRGAIIATEDFAPIQASLNTLMQG